MTDNTPILKVNSIGKKVSTATGELTILQDISFSLSSGDSVAVVGVSGSGKSTLLSLLAGLDTPTSGEIELCGQSLVALDEDGRASVRGENVGFVFQSFHLLPNLTALENTLLPLEISGQSDETAARELLCRVGLGERLLHYPRQLSGGEQQRVAIARAFITKPKVLFADEPTGNLDHTTGEKIIELLFELNQELNTTLILVTHDDQLAKRCKHRLEIHGGKLVNLS